MDLSTSYLGLKLRTPLVPSASPLSQNLDNIRKMEDAGASAVVFHSLFEEQIRHEQRELYHHLNAHTESFPEALNFFPEPEVFNVGPEEYLENIRRAKAAVKIPVIGSLNGSTPGGWLQYARQIEQAGADALELNIYYIPTDMTLSSELIENTYFEILKAVKSSVRIPVALKLSPFFSNMAYIAKKFDDAGADGLVLFNRFYQPDIELETLEVRPDILLSSPLSTRLPLRWIAILYGKLRADLAATSGIQRTEDVIKMLLAGASVTMLCSALFRYGIEHIYKLETGIRTWMEEHEYDSVKQMQGSMSQVNCANASAFERAQYIKSLQTYKHSPGKT